MVQNKSTHYVLHHIIYRNHSTRSAPRNRLEIDWMARVLPPANRWLLDDVVALVVNKPATIYGCLFVREIRPQVDAAIDRLQYEELDDLLEDFVVEPLDVSAFHAVKQLHRVRRP